MMRQFCLLLIFLGCKISFSQNLDSLLEIQRLADPQEKIYIHFDKNYYNAGETIWFKAYLFAGIDPSDVSRNFYAELLDEQGNVLYQRTAPVFFSGASGSFDLDTNFNKPLVFFRAYTVSMLNSDTSFIYTKAIRVLSPKSSTLKKASINRSPVLRFFPEGGNFVAGLPSVVAFTAMDQQEQPLNINGTITDNTGAKVAALKTVHNGMGSFAFTPEAGKTYTATWKDESGKQYTTALPTAKAQGIVLKINDEKSAKRFTINRTSNVPAELQQLYVAGYINQHLAFRSSINMENRLTATGIFPTNDFPTGILQITVFDAAYKPLAERITFINNDDFEMDGDAYFTQKNFTKRGLNQVEILVSDTLPSNLSISITDADLNESNTMEDNIISRLLLTGDLRGKIVDPYYYFYSNRDSVPYHLDLVMLTHGWRRYNWDNVLAGKIPEPKWQEYNYLAINGKIQGLAARNITPDLKLDGILETADSAKTIISLPVDKNGTIFSDGLLFYDHAKLYFNFNKKNIVFDKSLLTVDNGLRKPFKKVLPDTSVKFRLPDITTQAIAGNIKTNQVALQVSKELANAKMLQGVTVTAKAKTEKDKMDEKYASGLFSGDAARSFDLVNDPLASGYMDIFQYLQGKVAGLQITNSGGTPSLSWRGGAPAVYLNEMQTDISMLASTPVSDIAYVKVFRPGESMAMGGGNGVIAVYTRKGGDAKSDPNAKGLSYVQLMGYSPVKEFYAPDYATFNERHLKEDVRTTLYWNPAIYLDKSRKRYRIKFYNNDITKRFRIIMEGLNAHGKLIHVEKVVGEQ